MHEHRHKQASSAPPPAPPGAIYTCPMHPEVRQDHPGACPLCGMALEPLEPAIAATPNPELADMRRRLWIGLAFAIPVFALAMPGHALNWIELVLATPVVLWAGSPFFVRGWASLRSRHLNMFTLIALGTGTAYLYSVVATVFPAIFPAGFRLADGAVPTYFEPAAVITVLVLLGQVLELRAREQTGGAIRALLDLSPKTARRLRGDGSDETITLDQVNPGDRLRVRPGDSVPVDGTVLDGNSAIDESMVTGESLPVEKHPGEHIIGGTVNGTGALIMRAEKVGADTMLARIIALVAEAQRSRAPIQRLADRVAGIFVPAVITVALLAFAGWAAWGPSPALTYALIAAVSVLIIACPCALGLATPMSIMVGVGKGAHAGVLIRSAEALEHLEKIDTLVIDKTGTLTEGKPKVVAVIAPALPEAEILAYAAALERSSEHPLATAVLAAAAERHLKVPEATNFASLTGQGITGDVAGHQVALGNQRLLATLSIVPGDFPEHAEVQRRDGATVLFLAIDGGAAGLIAVADPIKATTAAALTALTAQNIRIVMLTGDNRTTAEAVARRLGVTEIEADALPEDKQRIVQTLRADRRVVAMAGDGVNDAPALAAADIGIAMGTGTDVAIQSAGITLVKGDLAGIARAVALSRAVMRNIRQNLFFAFLYNSLGIPIAAAGLLSPAIAALAMSLSSVSVIANALRLRRVAL